jgi:hypothetical protein
MNYIPSELPVGTTASKQTTFAKKGENLLDLSQFLGTDYAKRIENLLPIADGRLEKCQGYTDYRTQGTAPITNSIIFNGNDYFGTGDKLYVNSTLVKTMAGSGTFSLVRFGDYIMVTNGTEKVGRVTSTLAFDGQTVNYTVGLKVTGGTSGATGIILEMTDAGATGTLTLGEVTPNPTTGSLFIDNENLTDSGTGNGVVNGTLTFTYTTISLAPICERLFIYNKRLVCGAISTDKTKVICSEEFTGTFPVFTFPAAATPALTTDQFNYSFSNGGDVKDFAVLGSQLITLYARGEAGIRADVLDYSGVGVRLNIITDFQRQGLGGLRALSTKYGVFYTNDAGVYQMTSGGNTNQPYSEQQVVITKLFDDAFIDTLDFSNSTLYLDEKRNLLYIACAESSSFNNLVLVYNIDTKAFTRRTGWYISSFYNDGLTVYGSSSIEGKIYKLFDGNTDGDQDIAIIFEQEFTQGNIAGLQMLQEVYAGGSLADDQTVTIEFDIYNKAGTLISNYKTLDWSLSAISGSGLGIGTGGIGSTPIGGGGAYSLTTQSLFHKMLKIHEWSRLVVRLTEESGLPLELNWLSLVTVDKGVNKKYTY